MSALDRMFPMEISSMRFDVDDEYSFDKRATGVAIAITNENNAMLFLESWNFRTQSLR